MKIEIKIENKAQVIMIDGKPVYTCKSKKRANNIAEAYREEFGGKVEVIEVECFL